MTYIAIGFMCRHVGRGGAVGAYALPDFGRIETLKKVMEEEGYSEDQVHNLCFSPNTDLFSPNADLFSKI